ncbi:MAG: GAF domain-containing protein, partial [Chrysiogenales bacterium]
MAAIFIHYDEYAGLHELLSLLSFTDMSYQFIIFGGEDAVKGLQFENLREISEFRHAPLTGSEFVFIVRKTLAVVNDLYLNRSLQEEYLAKLVDTKKDQEDLIDIGRALSLEKDQGKLLRLILFLSKRITGADAGSIYLVEKDEGGNRRLRFKYSHTFSRDIPLEEHVIPIDKKSISGYVAVTGEVLNIPDVYELPDDAPYSFNSSFDEKNNYRCRSMLVVPMKNHVDEIIGVIQRINSKEADPHGDQGKDVAFSVKLLQPMDFVKHVVTFNHKYD